MNSLAPADLAPHVATAFALLESLTAENSFTFNVEGVRRNANLVEKAFLPLGFQAERVACSDPRFGDHLFLRRNGHSAKRGCLLVTHLDTVFPPEEEKRNDFHWKVEADRFSGPGVLDNKGGTILIWLVLTALRESRREVFESFDWLIAANAAEEELPPDFADQCALRLPANCLAALVFESCAGPDGHPSLVRARKGSVNLRITVSGRGAHAGSRHAEGANAIHALARIIPGIEALTDVNRHLTANVGWIGGGGPTNRVPHEAACEVNLRAFDNAVLDEAVGAIQALAAEGTVRAVSDGFPCSARVTIQSRNPAWQENDSTNALIARWQDAARTCGFPLGAAARGGLSDGNYLSRFLPVLDGLGPLGGNGHASERSPDGSKMPEFAVKESFAMMAAVTATALADLP